MLKYLIAHRGAITESTIENSFESLIGIKKYENTNNIIYGIEFDVQQTDSGDLICYHDEDLIRLHKTTKKVKDLTNEDIKNYDIAYLKDVLENFRNTGYILNIEIKIYGSEDIPKACSSINNLIIEHGLLDNCIVSSFEIEIIEEMLTNYPKIKSRLIIKDELSDNILNRLIDMGMKGICINKEQHAKTDYFLSRGLKLMLYTFFNDNGTSDEEILKSLSNYDDICYITDSIDSILNF